MGEHRRAAERSTPPRSGMRVLVLGATGGTGRHVVEQALTRGQRVTAFVRAPEKLAARDGLVAVRGDPRDAGALSAAAVGHDVILSALGPRTRQDGALMPACTKSILASCAHAAITRVVLVSSALLFPDIGALGGFFRWLTRGALRGARESEGLLMQSDLACTVVRPVRLTDAPAAQAYRAAIGRLPEKPRPIARADVARFLLEQAERADPRAEIVGLCR